MTFQTVTAQKLYQQVADQVAGLIRAGELRAGDRLPSERDLGKKLGVSRPTIREAMVALELSGLVDVKTGAGVFVRPGPAAGLLDTGHSAFELLAARRLVEAETTALAARVATADDLARIDAAIEQQRADYLEGGDGFDGDRAFHLAVAQASCNMIYLRLVDDFWGDMRGPIFNRLCELSRKPVKTRTNLADHARVRDCIARRDEAGAREAMVTHLKHVEASFIVESTAPAVVARTGARALANRRA